MIHSLVLKKSVSIRLLCYLLWQRKSRSIGRLLLAFGFDIERSEARNTERVMSSEDFRRQRAILWYQRMGFPDRENTATHHWVHYVNGYSTRGR